MLVVLCVAFALRLYRLEDANIWWDEGLAVWAARQSPAEIARWTAADVHPPLYFWLLHGWRRLAGDHEFAVRYLSVAFGTLTVAALWTLGRRLFPHQPTVATLGALFLACSRFAVWWSQETRMYMLGGLLVTLSLAFAVGWRADSPWRVVSYVFVTTAALWTLYLLVLVPAIVTFYWLWERREHRGLSWKARLAAQGAVILLFLPWVFYTLLRLRSWSVEGEFSTTAFVNLYAVLLTLGRSTQIEPYFPLAWGLLVGAVGLGLAAPWSGGRLRGETAAILLLFLMLVAPPLAVWAVTMIPRSLGYVPKPEARYLLPFAPPFALLLALAGYRLWALRWGQRPTWKWVASLASAAWGILILGIQLWSLSDYYGGRYLADDYRSLTATLRAHWQPGDVVVLHTDESWPIFAYYWPAPFVGTPHRQKATPEGAEYLLRPLWEANQGVWLVVNEEALEVDPQRAYEDWLAQRAAAQHEWRFGSKRLLLFARTPERAARLLETGPGFRPPPPPRPLASSDGARLVGWEQAVRRVRAGELVHLALTVSGPSPPRRLTLSLVEETTGQGVATVERSFDGSGPTVRRVVFTVPVPARTKPGRYTWHVQLGDSQAREGVLEVLPPAVSFSAANFTSAFHPEHEVQVEFGEPTSVRLVGYTLDRTTDTLRVVLYWAPEGPLPIPYKVFVHLTTPEGRVVTQHDGFPAAGQRPTTSWQAGELIADPHPVPLTPDVKPGTYFLKAGLYDPATGQRLGPVKDADGASQPDNQIVLGEITLP